MPILNQGKEYYPLEFGRMIKNGKTYYDRSARGESWFYVDLRGSQHELFIPRDSTFLATAGGNVFSSLKQT